MAENHVQAKVKNAQNKSIFIVFDNLFKAGENAHLACAQLLDTVKGCDAKVGSSSVLEYSTKRLVRGLASNSASRQSVFFSALTTALAKDVISCEFVIEALNKEVSSSVPSKNDSTALIITVLTIGALIKSEKFLLFSKDVQTDLLTKLLYSGKCKSYLQFAAISFTIELLNVIPKSAFNKVLWPLLVKEWKAEHEKISESEFCAVIVLAVLRFPKATRSFVDEVFPSKEIMLENVAEYAVHYSPNIQKDLLHGMCTRFDVTNEQLLKIWEIVLNNYVEGNFKTSMYILRYIKVVLENASDISVVQKLICQTSVKIIMTHMNRAIRPNKQELLDALSSLILESLVTRLTAATEKEYLAIVTDQLLFQFGDLQFDLKTNTKTVQTLINHMTVDQVDNVAHKLEKVISGVTMKNVDGDAVGWNTRDKQFAFMMLGRLLHSTSFQTEPERLHKHINFAFSVGFGNYNQINTEIKKMGKIVFYKSIELRSLKIDAAVNLLDSVVCYINTKVLSTLSTELKDSVSSEWANVLTANLKMSRKGDDKKYVAMRLLLLHMGLMLFKDPEMASASIQELLQCIRRIKRQRDSEPEGEEPHWVEVTVDLLLSMLSRDNKILRHVVTTVFPNIAPLLTPTALQQIVDALDPSIQNDVLQHVDSEDSDNEASGESGDEVEDNSEDSAIEDDESEKDTVNDKLRMAVRNALGYSAALTDDESVDMDDMNEDEEQQLNNSLANAFKLFKIGKTSNKKKQSKSDESVTHFRLRVLDLVELVIGCDLSLPSCLELIQPLLSLLEFSIKDPHQKPLQHRLEVVLKKLGSIKKFNDLGDVGYQDVLNTFKALFEREVSGLVYVEMGPVIVECSGMLVRATMFIPPENDTDTLERYYKGLLDKYFENNDRRVPFGVFTTILRMFWAGNWLIAQHVMELMLDKDLKLFKKQQLANLLEIFYKNDRLQSSATDDCKAAVSAFESSFVEKFAKLLEFYNGDPKLANALYSFHVKLLPIIPFAMKAQKKYRHDFSGDSQWGAVTKQLLQNNTLFKHQKTKRLLLQLASSCNVEVPDRQSVSLSKSTECESAGQKRAHSDEDVDNNEDDEALKKKKKKSKKYSKKLKLESREQRAAISSEGLGDINFSGVNPDTLNEFSDESSSEEEKTKKKNKRTKQEV